MLAKKIYTCDNCHFIFTRTGECEQCPDCGKKTVRDANSDEIKKFYERQKADYANV